jgi:hypothetical protein
MLLLKFSRGWAATILARSFSGSSENKVLVME